MLLPGELTGLAESCITGSTLRMPYAMSGTDLAYALWFDAMSGTDRGHAYRATHPLRDVRY
eukprot:3941557-Rhodomonas_salina.3